MCAPHLDSFCNKNNAYSPRRDVKEEKCTSVRSHDIGTGALSVAVVTEDPSLWCFEFSNAGGMQAVD